MSEQKHLVDVRDLKEYFTVKAGMLNKMQLKAVDGVSFTIDEGETLGLVGESGCGKTTVGRTLLHLYKPTAGEVYFDGVRVTEKNIGDFRKDMQIVFQDPYSSLHPRMKVGTIISEPLLVSGIYKTKAECRERVCELLEMVGLDRTYIDRYPHEFSGGQRQRIVIARALATNPDLLICDEPVSALDVSVRAQVLNLLEELQDRLHLTYLFISHDLSVVEHICDRVAIMYLGQLMEIGTVDQIYDNPQHPYTQALLSAIPKIGKARETRRILLEGDIPSPVDPPSGCRFRTRCRYAAEACAVRPEPVEMEPGHVISCIRLAAQKEDS